MPSVWNKKDWALSGSEEYAEYMLQARDDFMKHRNVTLNKVKEVYTRAANSISSDMTEIAKGSLDHRYLADLQKALNNRAVEINDRLLDVIYDGVRLSAKDGTSGNENIAKMLFSYDKAGVKAMFADINEQAVLAILTRTGKDGLKLSDRVWRAAESARNNVQVIIEDAVARGRNSRETAKMIQKYLQPGKWTAMKKETQKILGVSSDVSYEGMRLARTEMTNAFHEGTILSSQSMPSYLGIIWLLSERHPVPDVCDDYAGHNGDGFWEKGNEPMIPHPQCLCVALPRHEDPEAFAQRLKSWAHNPNSDMQLERWYNETGSKYVERPAGEDIKTAEKYGWISKVKQSLKGAPLNDRIKLAEHMRDVDNFEYDVALERMKDRGAVHFYIEDGKWHSELLGLQEDDNRALRYKIKTAFHETVHARGTEVQLTPEELIMWANNSKLAFKYEDTAAEVVAHYLVREAGIEGEIAPSYSKYLIEVLPSLKKNPEFAECKTIADFGERLAKYRFSEPRKIGWEEIDKIVRENQIDVLEYAEQYKDYVFQNMDSIVETIAENTGDKRPVMKNAIKDSIRRGWIMQDTDEIGFADSLAIAMNRLGVK
jgi:hypothetical protein